MLVINKKTSRRMIKLSISGKLKKLLLLKKIYQEFSLIPNYPNKEKIKEKEFHCKKS
jgi:hypothetical protein